MSSLLTHAGLIALLSVLALSSCDSGSDTTATGGPELTPSDNSEALVSVNGVNITRAQVEDHLRRKSEGREPTSQNTDEAIDELVNIELLHQQAIEEGYDKNPEVLAEARMQKRNLIVDALVLDKAAKANFTDEQLRAEYEEKIGELPKFEHHARHILVETETEANAILAALDQGQDFAALAQEKSIDPTAEQGGDLGWFRSSHMVESFADAVESLEVGQTTDTPVESEFGWHVIRLDERRETKSQVPTFEQVKERMRAALIGEMIQAQVDELRAQADIQQLAAP